MRPPPVPIAAGRAARAAALPAAVAAAAALVSAVPSEAGDQRISGSISQTFLADTNVRLDDRTGAEEDEGGGFSVGSVSRLDLRYVNATPSSQLSLATGVSFALFSAEEASDLDGLFPSLSGSYRVQRSTRSLGFSFSGAVRPVESNDLGILFIPGDIGDPDDPDDDEDPTLILENEEADALRISISGGASYTESISSTESLSLGASLSHQSFTETTDDLRPSTQLSTNAGWSRQLTARANAGVSGFTSVILSGESAEQVTYTAAVTPTFSYAQTPDIIYSASLGPSISYITGTLPGSDAEEGFSPGLRGSAGFTYAGDVSRTSLSLTQAVVPNDEGVPVNQTSLSASFSRRVTATSSLDGSLSARYRSPLSGGGGDDDETETTYGYAARAGFTQQINTYSSADIGLSANFSDDGEEAETIFGVSGGYTYRLTPLANANLAYTFRTEAGDEAEAPSHRISLTLSQAFTLLP